MLFDAGGRESSKSNSNRNRKCNLLLQDIQNILVPLHDHDAQDCHEWDCKQGGNKDPEGFSFLQRLKKTKKEK